MPERDHEPRPETDCCASAIDPRIARHFDQKMVVRTAAGKLPPLHAVSRRLLEQLSDVRDVRPTVLELGCGSGALTVDLLQRGASQATGVDLSPGSIGAARRRAEDAGVAGRATFQVGDGASTPLAAHDWVVLDRVICCYPDVEGLIGNAIRAAADRIALSVPSSLGWRGIANRLLMKLEFVVTTLQRRPCPGYVHDVRWIEGRLAEAGFSRLAATNAGLWYVSSFERHGSVDGRS